LPPRNSSIRQSSPPGEACSLATLFEKQVFAETIDGIDFHAALGHFLIEMPGMRLVHHSGGVSGWRSVYVVIPETRRGLCVLINSDAGNEFWIELLKEWVGMEG
jgi:hypothetical protein